MDEPVELPKGERAMISRARLMFVRFVGLERGDEMADELLESRAVRYRPHGTGAGQVGE